jgi:hypothetical protein
MYEPTSAELIARRWFPRKPLTDAVSHEHILFPVTYSEGMPKCLCRRCTPAWDVRDEENIQTAYVKHLELYLSALGYVIPQRGRAE